MLDCHKGAEVSRWGVRGARDVWWPPSARGWLNKRGAGVNRRTEGKLESRLQSSPAEGVTVTEAEAGCWGWFVRFFRSIFFDIFL